MREFVMYNNGLKQRLEEDADATRQISAERRRMFEDKILPALISILAKEGIEATFKIVGSVDTDDATSESDLDLLVRVKSQGQNKGSFGVIRNVLEDLRRLNGLDYHFHVHQAGEQTQRLIDMEVTLKQILNAKHRD